MPPTWEERLCLYVTHCSDRGMQSSTIKSYVSAIRFVLTLDGHIWNDDKALLSMLTRATKLENDRVRNRFPIQKGLLDIIVYEVENIYNSQPFLESLYKTLFLIGYYGMFRIGEITRGPHVLKAKDVHLGKNKDKMLFILHSSKAHGKESRPQTVKITATPIHERRYRHAKSDPNKNYYCPFETASDYLKLRGGYTSIDEQLFVFNNNQPVEPKHLRGVLKKILKKLGLNSQLYNTHSLRIGRATDLMAQGYSIDQIKHLGRWKSPAVLRYLKGL